MQYKAMAIAGGMWVDKAGNAMMSNMFAVFWGGGRRVTGGMLESGERIVRIGEVRVVLAFR